MATLRLAAMGATALLAIGAAFCGLFGDADWRAINALCFGANIVMFEMWRRGLVG